MRKIILSQPDTNKTNWKNSISFDTLILKIQQPLPHTYLDDKVFADFVADDKKCHSIEKRLVYSS